MRAPLAWLIGLVLLTFASSRPAFGDEIDELLNETKTPARFAGHRANFRVEPVDVTFQGPAGPFTQKVEVVRDGDRVVAVHSLRPRLDLITHDPALAPREVVWPARYHNQTYFHATLTTISWFERWGITGDEHSFSWKGGGETLTLESVQRWKADGVYPRNSLSRNTYTLRCDPRLGYVIDVSVLFETDQLPKGKGDQPAGGFEMTNLLVSNQSNPWPDRWRYDRTVISRADLPKGSFYGWANNNVAADRSDDKGMPVRNGGLLTFLTPGEPWPPALSRWGNHTFGTQTCNVWQDQHNHVDYPAARDADGLFRVRANLRLCFLPPEVEERVTRSTALEDFKSARAVIVRLGRVEDFEDQPLPLTTTTRGMATHKLDIQTGNAASGERCLVMKGDMNPETRGVFLFLPQVPLEASTRYRIAAKARVEGDGVRADLTADTYEWTPHDPARLTRQSTTESASGAWTPVELEFTTPPTDVFVDLRFRVRGPGVGYFDDFEFRKLGPARDSATGGVSSARGAKK